MAFLAVEGAIDDIAGVGERGRELPVEIGIILDDEEPQGRVLPLIAADIGPRSRNRCPQALLCHYIGMGERSRKPESAEAERSGRSFLHWTAPGTC